MTKKEPKFYFSEIIKNYKTYCWNDALTFVWKNIPNNIKTNAPMM